MWHPPSCYVALPALVLTIFTTGCGGGGGSGGTLPASPQPDFSIAVSPGSLDLQQGAASPPVTISITPQNGFSTDVEVRLSGIPNGVASNPQGTFAVPAGGTASIILGADPSVSTGQFSITAEGTSGSLSHSATLTLNVQAGPALNLPRTTYIRNDSVPALDAPAGEPRHRRIVYDPSGQRFFVANRAMNRVEVFSGASPSLTTMIDAPGVSSVDLSPDGATLWVGTELEQILAIDTGTLKMRTRLPVTGLSPIPGVVFDRPTELLSLPNGRAFVRMQQSSGSQALLALWDSSGNTFVDLTSVAPALFQAGLGIMTHSDDRSRVFVTANDSSGQIAMLDATGTVVAGPLSLGNVRFASAAANRDGTRFAIALNSGGTWQVKLLDPNLNMLGAYASSGPGNLLFSRDGRVLFVSELLNGSHLVTALATVNLQPLGQTPDLAVQGLASSIEDLDASQLLCGLSNRGVAFLDASQPGTLVSAAPAFASAPAVEPGEGPNTGGTAALIAGTGFSGAPQIRFGWLNPVTATAVSGSQLQVSSPPSVAVGPVNLTGYFDHGWIAVAPAAFSYGPLVTAIWPNGGSSGGGDTVAILGYGFGTSAAGLNVIVGGHSAAVQTVESLPAFASAAGLDSLYPFPLQRITVTTPSGSPGKMDVSITARSGSTALPKAFQYLTTSHTYVRPALYKFVLYDSSRHQVYLSATDHVDVFNLQTDVFGSPIEPPPNGPPPDAALRGLALTPDHSQLIVADFGAQSVYLINPDGVANNGVKVPVGGVAGFLNSGPARVATTSVQTVFVGLSGEGGSTGTCSGCLGQMNLVAGPPTFEPAPQPEVTTLTGAPLLQANDKGDSLYLAFASAPGGPVAAWSASSPDAFDVSPAQYSSSDLTTSADGTLFATTSHNSTQVRSADLTWIGTATSAELENIPNRVIVPGLSLHPSGSLVYEPFLTGPPPSAPPPTGIRGGVDIRDSHNGRLRMRVYLPEPFAMLSTDTNGLHGCFLAIDENGKRLFALTTSGLTVLELANVPLGLGTVTPSSGSATGGEMLTIRGSGFVQGTAVTFNGKSATVSFRDMNSLQITTPKLDLGPQQIVLTNPDGESASLDAAFLAQ